MASAKLPTPDELKAVGRQLGMNLSDDNSWVNVKPPC